jgi:hypothetical protein
MVVSSFVMAVERCSSLSFVMVVGASVNALGDIKSIRMFEDGVTSFKHALAIQGGSLLGGLCWWRNECN